MGPFLRGVERLPWEPEVMILMRSRSQSHVGSTFRLDNGGIGISCTCGWVTRDQRRYMANWRRHRNAVRNPVERF